MKKLSFQDLYPEELAHCYGCGKNNNNGHQLKTYWLDNKQEKTISLFTPEDYHIAIPGYVYGGLIASIIDCHGTGSAAAMAYKSDEREMGTQPIHRFVTAALNVDFLAPTPLGVELELVGTFEEVKQRKIVVEITLSANSNICAKGKVVAVKMPENMM